MVWINEFIGNKILWISIGGWLIAQVFKAILYALINRRFSFERLVGDGGMPSCHSATVCALATAVGLESGFGSTVFAVAVIFAIIVMHDAVGVRYETGKQSQVINDMIDLLKTIGEKEITPHEKLKEFVGHTPVQVVAGALLGIGAALLLY